MNIKWGGASSVIHSLQIDDSLYLELYPNTLMVGNEQTMTFDVSDNCPFYLSEEQCQQEQKHDQSTGKTKTCKLKKSGLINALEGKLGITFLSTNYWTINALNVLASNHGVAIDIEEDEIIQGWMNKPKGLLQILWEQGWINPNENMNNYVIEKGQIWLDLHGKVLPESENDAKKSVLTNLLSKCPDFKFEKSAMQKLAGDLSLCHQRKIELLVMPKYHCELAGEGIEYAWGLFKKYFRWAPHLEKKGKTLFTSCVETSLKKVTVFHVRRFSARARRYMLTYSFLDSPESLEGHGLSYREIEQYVD